MKALEKVIELLAEYKEMEASKITPESTFSGLGLDSLDTVELVMNIEEAFNISIEMNENIKTVQDLTNIIEGKIND